MSRDLLWIAFLGLVWFVLKYRPDWFNHLLMTVLGKAGLEAVGRKAMSGQPDFISLQAGASPARPEAKSAIESLERRGFVRAGDFAIPEMQGLPVHFLVKEEESAIAVVYEHPEVGVWCDLVSRYADGSSITVTNAPVGGGLDPRPDHDSMRAPGLTPGALHIRLIRERPQRPLRTVTAAALPSVFTDAYREEIAWRKGRGLSATEVRNAALERTA